MEFEFADQFQIEAFEGIAIVFFQDILGMNYFEMLVTDESALSDFAGCGEECSDFPQELENPSLPRNEEYELWSKWVCRKILDPYGIGVACAGIYLVDLFRQIKTAWKPKIQ